MRKPLLFISNRKVESNRKSKIVPKYEHENKCQYETHYYNRKKTMIFIPFLQKSQAKASAILEIRTALV